MTQTKREEGLRRLAGILHVGDVIGDFDELEEYPDGDPWCFAVVVPYRQEDQRVMETRAPRMVRVHFGDTSELIELDHLHQTGWQYVGSKKHYELIDGRWRPKKRLDF